MNQRNHHSAEKRLQRIVGSLVFLCAFALIFYITGNKVNQYGHSDPLLTLPTAQALVQTGQPYLTHLADKQLAVNDRLLTDVIDNYQATRLNGEIIDVYSPGPAFLVVPLVFVLDRVGFDLANLDTNLAVQNRLAFLTSSIALLSLFVLCRIRLQFWPALIVSFVAFFGSSIFANMGLAYFNLNFTVVFVIWSLIILGGLEAGRISERYHSLSGILLGLFLFGAFSQRPSAALLIFISFGYLLLNHRKIGFYAMGTSALAFAIFALWSWNTYGEILPIYYDTGKSPELLPFWIGILGNLVSPSRGLFGTMPWTIVVTALFVLVKPSLNLTKLFPWIILWFVLLIITISRSVIWWGGASFGTRLLAEVIPGLTLLGAIVWSEFGDRLSSSTQRIFIVGFLVTGFFSIWGHSYQPFFNIYAGGPWQNSITGYPIREGQVFSTYFDLSYSQLLASRAQICTLQAEMVDGVVQNVPIAFIPISGNTEIDVLQASQFNVDQIAEAQFWGDEVALNKQPVLISGYLLNQDGVIEKTCDQPTLFFYPADPIVENQELKFTIEALTGEKITLDSGALTADQVHLIELTQLPEFFDHMRSIEVEVVERDN